MSWARGQSHSGRSTLLLADGQVIPSGIMARSRMVTPSHQHQGKTVDKVLVVASSRSLPAIDEDDFYVRVTRW